MVAFGCAPAGSCGGDSAAAAVWSCVFGAVSGAVLGGCRGVELACGRGAVVVGIGLARGWVVDDCIGGEVTIVGSLATWAKAGHGTVSRGGAEGRSWGEGEGRLLRLGNRLSGLAFVGWCLLEVVQSCFFDGAVAALVESALFDSQAVVGDELVVAIAVSLLR